MGHPAPEVAARLTRVLSTAAGALPGVTAVRGSSMQGMAYVDVVFASGAALHAGRQSLLEALAGLRAVLPAEVRVTVGPEASSTGWVYQYALVDPTQGWKPIDLRRFQDEVLRPALGAIPGVAEVASVGGDLDELTVNVSSEGLRAQGLAFSDVVSTVRAALAGAPAGGPPGRRPRGPLHPGARAGPGAARRCGAETRPRHADGGRARALGGIASRRWAASSSRGATPIFHAVVARCRRRLEQAEAAARCVGPGRRPCTTGSELIGRVAAHAAARAGRGGRASWCW